MITTGMGRLLATDLYRKNRKKKLVIRVNMLDRGQTPAAIEDATAIARIGEQNVEVT